MPEPSALLARLSSIVEPILSEHALELVELTCRPQGRQLVVRLLVDHVGGVTIQRCARANQLIGEALERANLIEGRYTVEVSSPGLDRPLVNRRDFERAIGDELRLEVSEGPAAVSALVGMLLAVQPDAIVLKTTSGNITVPLSQIRMAKKSVRW